MSWQQVAMIVWLVIDIVVGLMEAGKPKEGTYRFGPVLIGTALVWYILYSAGFWN